MHRMKFSGTQHIIIVVFELHFVNSGPLFPTIVLNNAPSPVQFHATALMCQYLFASGATGTSVEDCYLARMSIDGKLWQ